MAGPKAGSLYAQGRLDRAPLGRVSRASECAGVGGTTGKQPRKLDQGTTDTRREGGGQLPRGLRGKTPPPVAAVGQ